MTSEIRASQEMDRSLLSSPPSSDSLSPVEQSTDNVSRSTICDSVSGIFHSRIFRAILLTGGALVALCLLAHPVGWVIAAVAVGGVAIGILGHMLLDKAAYGSFKQRVSFELTAINRMISGFDWSTFSFKDRNAQNYKMGSRI